VERSSAPATPGWWTEFVDHVVPVLQKRGSIQIEYAPGSLRNEISGRGPVLPDHRPARQLRDDVRQPSRDKRRAQRV
jgi:hypothetical protein